MQVRYQLRHSPVRLGKLYHGLPVRIRPEESSVHPLRGFALPVPRNNSTILNSQDGRAQIVAVAAQTAGEAASAAATGASGSCTSMAGESPQSRSRA